MLSEENLQTLREQLLAERDELQSLANNEDALTDSIELDQSRVGRLSRMDAMAGQAMSRATRERRKYQLELIDNALTRIDRGEYGLCEECLRGINPKRLALNPSVELCIDCAEAAERRD